MGINEQCGNIPRWRLYDDLANIELGVRALRGNVPAVLKRYNAKWYKNHYIRDVMALQRQLEQKAQVKVDLRVKGRGASERTG
jgi:hypothetical protein